MKLTTSNVGEKGEENFHLLLIGMENNTTTLEDDLVIPNKSLLPFDPRIVFPCIWLNELKHLSTSNLPVNIYSSFMYNC